jgi:ubiquinone/menaquinone biosynthesis C-methylase UbiE
LFDKIKKISILYYLLFPKLFGIGYNQYKWHLIKKKIQKKHFKLNSYIDERIVEIPWVIDKLSNIYNLKILDAGCTLNYRYLIDKIIGNNNKITFVNLYRENFSDRRDFVNYLDSDISNLNIQDESYDIVTCISVLEHIGFDNQIYNNSVQKISDFLLNKDLYINGILEIRRVLKSEGIAYLSFPFGKGMLFNNLQQFDNSGIKKIINVFQPKSYSVQYYKYINENKNWEEVSQKSCEELMPVYFNRKTAISGNSVALLTLCK